METEMNKLREGLIGMLTDARFGTDKDYELKVLVYNGQKGGSDGDSKSVVSDGESDSDDNASDAGSDDNASVDDESGDELASDAAAALRSHPIDVGEITLEDTKTYEGLLGSDLFKDLREIFGREPKVLYSEDHFNYYNAHYEKYEDRNNKLLDMYQAVDTMMLGLPYQKVYD